jgi:hypothetical protein
MQIFQILVIEDNSRKLVGKFLSYGFILLDNQLKSTNPSTSRKPKNPAPQVQGGNMQWKKVT